MKLEGILYKPKKIEISNLFFILKYNELLLLVRDSLFFSEQKGASDN